MIDDSSLFHGTYDPVKAREYYLRTRQLKGRRRTSASLVSPGKGGRRPSGGSGKALVKPSRSNTKSRRAELEARKEALEKRLDLLRTILRKKVAEAKALSAQNAPKDKKGSAPATKVDKASSSKSSSSSKSDKPLTASQKAKKAKAAKEAYEKEKPTSLSTDIKVLEKQIEGIRAKIQEAVDDARVAKRKKAGKMTLEKR